MIDTDTGSTPTPSVVIVQLLLFLGNPLNILVMSHYLTKIILISGGEEVYVGVGDNTILECDEAKHQPVTSVEWFCRSDIILHHFTSF